MVSMPYENNSAGLQHWLLQRMIAKIAQGLGYHCIVEDRSHEDRAIKSFRPDVTLALRNRKLFRELKRNVLVEVQNLKHKKDGELTADSKKWLNDTNTKYHGMNLIIIDMSKVIVDRKDGFWSNLEDVHDQVRLYVETGTSLKRIKQQSDTIKESCDHCGKKFSKYSLFPHMKRCAYNPVNKNTY